MKIKKLEGKEILDSRGNPTIAVSIELENGVKASASIPSGASKGTFEALELRDLDPSRYGGQGVLKACKNIQIIFESIKHLDVEMQREIDLQMIQLDATENKSKLGANAILGVSFACLKASAKHQNKQYFVLINELLNSYFKKEVPISLPTPLFNILNGGQHSNNGLDFQEFIITPFPYAKRENLWKRDVSAKLTNQTCREQVRIASEILHSLKKIINHSGESTGIGDEGGYAPMIPSIKDALNLVCEAVTEAGYKLYDQVSLGIDCASNYYYDEVMKLYVLQSKGEHPNPKQMDYQGMASYYTFLLENYPITYLEDFFHESDWECFSQFLSKSTEKIAFCGDDLIVTNTKRLEKAIELKSINAMIVKPNQIGTFYETLSVINMCLDNNILYVPSHRSGETNDALITDIAVGTGAKLLKAGATQRGERIAKYNRLVEIEDYLQSYYAE